MTVKTGPAKTGPAGPLATAMIHSGAISLFGTPDLSVMKRLGIEKSWYYYCIKIFRRVSRCILNTLIPRHEGGESFASGGIHLRPGGFICDRGESFIPRQKCSGSQGVSDRESRTTGVIRAHDNVPIAITLPHAEE